MQIPALTIADTCAFEDWNGLKRTMPLGNVVPLQRQKEIITWWHEVFDLLTATLTTLNNLFFLWTQIIVNWPWIFVKLIFSLICGIFAVIRVLNNIILEQYIVFIRFLLLAGGKDTHLFGLGRIGYNCGHAYGSGSLWETVGANHFPLYLRTGIIYYR